MVESGFNLSLPIDPAGLAKARQALAGWLESVRVASAHVDDVLVAANEACMNAVEHSGAPPDSRVDLVASMDRSRVSLHVHDRGAWRDPVPKDDRGHGLGLMRELMDSVDIDRGADGTTVRLEKEVAFGEPAKVSRLPVSVTVGEVRGTTVAIVEGEVDLSNVGRVRDDLDGAARADGPLVIDLTAVTYIDSAGVHVLYRLARGRRLKGSGTRIVAPAGAVRRVLELTGIEMVIPVERTVDDAIDGLEARRA